MRLVLFERASAIPRDDWNHVLGARSLIYSVDFWQLLEHAGLNDFEFRYALIYDAAGKPAALTTFYVVTTDIAIFASPVLRALLARVRRLWSNFMKLRMIECGTPITVNAPVVCVEGADTAAIIALLDQELVAIGRRHRAAVLVIRDFESESEAGMDDFLRVGYRATDLLPNTHLEVPWQSVADYHASMKSYYRSKLKKHLRRIERQGIRSELVDDFAALSGTLCQQWQLVHDLADEYQREVLTPAFYRGLSERFGDRSKALLFYRNAALIGHAILLVDGQTLRWLYYGRSQPANDGFYIHVGNAVVETAIRLGLRGIDMGMTTYAVKKDLGARMVPVRMVLKSPWRWLDPLLGWGYGLLNRTPGISNRQVFKSEASDRA